MKKAISILLAALIVVSFAGCQNNTSLNGAENLPETLVCSVCGAINSIEHDFCSTCGCGIKASNGNSNFDFEDEYLSSDINVPKNYDIADFLKTNSDTPLIIYECDGIGKSQEIRLAYVIKNGQCRLYYCDTTLGDLSKMTDEEILEMLEKYYLDGLQEAVDIWGEDNSTYTAISNDKVKLYEPRMYDITSCLFTDETGNSVVGELLFFPKAGIGGDPYVIEYPQYTDTEDLFMNYYNTHKDSDSYRDIKFSVQYFGTGWGTKSDLNQINNVYYISNDSTTSGTVYNSHYYGLRSKSINWSKNDCTLCFRIDTPNGIHLRLDDMSSPNVAYIDPTENNLLQISHSYYNAYYNSFKSLLAVLNDLNKAVADN